jgi:hypothetical protein
MLNSIHLADFISFFQRELFFIFLAKKVQSITEGAHEGEMIFWKEKSS